MWSKSIDDLIEEARKPALRFLDECKNAGHIVVVTCTVRSLDVQEALYAQGRSPLDIVNAMRAACHLWPITEEENRRVVTWTMNTNHRPNELGLGRALDFAIKKAGVVIWNPKADLDDDGIPDYDECGKIAQKIGWEWGGSWKKPDRPHIQWRASI